TGLLAPRVVNIEMPTAASPINPITANIPHRQPIASATTNKANHTNGATGWVAPSEQRQHSDEKLSSGSCRPHVSHWVFMRPRMPRLSSGCNRSQWQEWVESCPSVNGRNGWKADASPNTVTVQHVQGNKGEMRH